MGLSTVLRFGLDLYEAYDDGMFDEVIDHFAVRYPDMYNFLPTEYQFGYPRTYGYTPLRSMYF